MDIYGYLKKDHRKVADLMEQVVASPAASEREQLFQQIKMELTLHADSEEKTFYQAVLDATRAKSVEEKMEHADHEHDEIREFLDKLSGLSADSSEWLIHFGELKHSVEHHVEEEEGEIFEKAKKYLSDTQAKDLAKEMDALKKQQMKSLKQPEPAM